jgi:hypothetical protein
MKTFKPGDKVQFIGNDKEIVNNIHYYMYETDIKDIKHGNTSFHGGINIGTVIRMENKMVVAEFTDERGRQVRLAFYPKHVKLIKTKKSYTKTIIDWENVPVGTYFVWNVSGSGKIATGRINIVDGYVYLCNNEHSGADEHILWGYKYSYAYSLECTIELLNPDHITLSDTCPKGHIIPELVEKNFHTEMAGYTPIICKGKVKFGCQTIPNSLIRELAASLKD